MSIKAAGLEYQNKVFTNAFTFTAVPSSIVHAGGVPIYIECNSQYLIDIEDCAHSLGAKWNKGKHVRYTAKIACFSKQSYNNVELWGRRIYCYF